MNLYLNSTLSKGFKNRSQISRVVTEAWAADELYCPECLALHVFPTPTNTKAIDFICVSCGSPYQLKSSRTKFYSKVPDGAYQTMISSIKEGSTPNLMLMVYSPASWAVSDLIWIPAFALTEQAIVPRKPLSVNARRSGWVGCNIDLGSIAVNARISMVMGGLVVDRHAVNSNYRKILPLKTLRPSERGWTMSVLNEIQKSGWQEFTTQQCYKFEEKLQAQFPKNLNVKPKIRQQLQVLRDLEILDHTKKGHWRVL